MQAFLSTSGDAGIDSDMGTHINGGCVIATGNMLDRISESKQNYVVMNFAESQKEGSTYTLKNDKDEVVAALTPMNDFTYLILSNEDIVEGNYTFWRDDTQLAGTTGQRMGGGMMRPENGEMPEMPEGMEPPEKPVDDKKPQNAPEGFGNPGEMASELTKEFAILSNGNYYSNVSAVENK